MRLVAFLAVVLLLSGCVRSGGETAAPAPSEPADPAQVEVASGALRGVVASDHRLFADIPYAAPPVGPLRFADPQPPAPWPGVRDATKYGPRCMQSLGGDLELGRQTDEDCLSLNVWTPAPTPSPERPRPVMVWIHGGAFVNGSGRIYDAARLAARGDIVVVTLNYRLGALGFLAHPALGPPGQVGNYGLADQQAALRWVRDNIAAFGGDPGRVTVAGESAGGMSVCDHLVAPGSRGLFAGAIIQSGPCQAQAVLPVAQDRSLAYAAAHGCADPVTAAGCLRALPADRLREPVWFYGIGEDQLSGPVTGSATLPIDPMAAIGGAGQDHHAARVPVLIGTTRDEFTLFVGMQYVREGVRYTPEDYPRLLATTFGPHAAAVAERYPLRAYPSVPLAYSAAVTDGVFSCVGDRLARALSGGPNGVPTYFYEFNDRAAPAPEPLRTLPFPVGASHSLELRYLFDVGGTPPLDPAQQKLADQMIDYWSAFVRSASPDADGQPRWDAFGDGGGDSGEVMSLQPDGSRMSADFGAEHQCAFWNGLK
jgi:para-nitrobenzyl esterase